MRYKRLLILPALLLGLSGPLFALDFSAALGRTSESSNLFRLSAQSDFDQRWFSSSSGHLSGYWDGTYSYWKGHKFKSRHSLSASPVLVYQFHGGRFTPYVEAGLGAALFSSAHVEGQSLGSALQFESRLGAGLRFGRQEVGLRFLHYSNAGLKGPNDGINARTLHYRFGF